MAEIEVTQNGSSVKASVGDDILLRLPEIPTTGYTWTVNTVDPPLRLVESSFVPPAGNGSAPAPGAGGERVIRLHAASPGEGTAELSLKRTWEDAPAETFTFRASVS
jgi:predicted secreted protein